MVKYREWLDRNYPNHQNKNILGIEKLIVDEAIEDLADFSMFIDLEELELVSAPDIFFGSGINTKLKSLKLKNSSFFNFFNIGGSSVPNFHGEMDLSNLHGLKKLEIDDDSHLQKRVEEAGWSLYCRYEIKVWRVRELETKIFSSSQRKIITVAQTQEGQIAELKDDLEKEKEKNNILKQKLDERISPEELAEILQTQMDLQTELEREKNKSKFLSEQLEEILQENSEAKTEIPPK